MEADMSEMIKIITLKNRVEAELMDAILKENGIPYVITSYYDNALDGIYQMQLGFGVIESYEEHKDTIIALYDDLMADSENKTAEETSDTGGEEEINRMFRVNTRIVFRTVLKILIWIIIIALVFFFMKLLFENHRQNIGGEKGFDRVYALVKSSFVP
jgi:ATP-dependent Zn protease